MARKKPRKWTRERVIEEAEAYGKELIDLKWTPKNSKDRALLRCKKCGHEFEQRCSDISRKGCAKCGVKKRANSKRKSTDEHRKEVKDVAPGYVLLGEYTNARMKTTYQCDKGHEFSMRPSDFLYGQRCPECKRERIRQLWQDETFRARVSESMRMQWQDETRRQRRSEQSRKLWQDEAFRERMSERSRMQWQDEAFRDRIRERMSERMSGENNPNYNPQLTDEERMYGRKTPQDREWTRRTKSMTGYKCEITGENTNTLESHHLYAHHEHVDIRYEPINAVVMTAEWHRTGEHAFHRIYGYYSDDPNDFIEWLDYLIEKTKSGELELELRRLYVLKSKVKRKMYVIDRSVLARIN